MGRKPALTPEQLEEVIKLYVDEQRGSEEIAALFGCSGTTIRNALKRNGIAIRGKSEASPSRTKIGDKLGNLEVIELLKPSRNSGVGCPKCAEYGYDTTKEAWMYLMRRSGEQQFGISNVITDRLATHRREGGWQLLEYIGPFKGDEAYMCEVAVKKWLEESIRTIPGHEENWFTKNLEIESLKELFDASGISNDFRLPTQDPTHK